MSDLKNGYADKLKAAMKLAPNVITISEGAVLSKRKAKRLAYQYRGSRRGLWYQRYLNGDRTGFFVAGNRLRKLPKFGRIKVTVVHSDTPEKNTLRELIASRINSGARSYSIEDPPEYRVSGAKATSVIKE